MLFECALQYGIRARDIAGVAEKLRFRLSHLNALLDRHCGKIGEPTLGFVHFSQLAEERADSQFGKPCAVAIFDRFVTLDGFRITLGFLGDLRKIEIDRSRLAVTRAFEILEKAL